jgi:hypothetical protein
MRESLYRTSQTLLVFVRVVFFVWIVPLLGRGCQGGDHMVVGFTTTYAITISFGFDGVDKREHASKGRLVGCMVFHATFNNISVISWQ